MKGRSVEGRLRFRSIELQMLVDQRKDEELMGKMIQEAQQNSRLIEKRKETDDILNAMVTNQK
jgi:hypothetical protein